MGHDEPADRLAGARVVAVRHRDLDEAAELERVRVLPRSPADVSGGVDRGAQPVDVCADGEADPVRVTGCGRDRLRAGRGHVDVRSRHVERRVEVVDARHRHGDALEIDVLAAQEALQPAQVVLELGDPHRLLAQHLDGSVAAAEAEPGAPAATALAPSPSRRPRAADGAAAPRRRCPPSASSSRPPRRQGWRTGPGAAHEPRRPQRRPTRSPRTHGRTVPSR